MACKTVNLVVLHVFEDPQGIITQKDSMSSQTPSEDNDPDPNWIYDRDTPESLEYKKDSIDRRKIMQNDSTLFHALPEDKDIDLMQHWINERNAPEILEYKKDIIDRLMQLLEEKVGVGNDLSLCL